jgi:hypothetical protein
MASWKKVIVSGSQAELLNITASAGLFNTSLNVGTNQQITTNPATTFLSGSFSGSFQGDVNINLADLTAGNGIVAFSYDGNSAQTVTLDTSSAYFTAGVRGKLSAAAYLGYDSATGGFTFDSGSYGTFAAGAGLTSTNGIFAVGAGTGITVNADDVQLKNAGSLTNNVLTKWDSSNGQLVNSGLTDDGTNLGIARNTSVTGFLSATGAITGSAVSASGTVQGLVVSAAQSITAGSFIQAGTNITAPSGYISAGSPAGAPNSVGAIQGQVGFFNTLSVTGGGSIGGNLTVTGDLTVAGTASFTNVDNLTVKDKFILINSGSTTLADSGWVTQYNAAGSGSAFYLEAGSTGTYGRFAMAYDVIGTSTAVSADEYVVSAKSAAGAPAAAPTWGGSGNGFGNVYVNSSNGDIYMYS